MSYKVQLSRDGKLIQVGGEKFCLGNLVHCVCMAADEQREKYYDELLDIGNQLLSPVSDSETARFEEMIEKRGQAGNIPDYDQTYHFRFGASGAYFAANVNGMMELLFQGDEFVQFGIQCYVSPIMIFGKSKSVDNIIEDISNPVEELYGQTKGRPSSYPGGKVYLISDDNTMSYISIVDKDQTIVTWRIGNSELWSNYDFGVQ